jgi:uncharacterized protein (DUF58 family)
VAFFKKDKSTTTSFKGGEGVVGTPSASYKRRARKSKATNAQKRERSFRKTFGKIFGVVWRVVAAIAFIAVMVCPAIFMNSLFGYMAILLVVLCFIADIACFVVIVRGIKTTDGTGDVTCMRGQNAGLAAGVANTSALACPKAQASLYVSDLFNDTEGTRDVAFMLDAKSEASFSFDADMSHVGVYRLGINDVAVFDFMGIFKKIFPINIRFNAVVLPRLYPIERMKISQEDAVATNRESRSVVLGGFDYTGVREYALGDPMKQIHWKLSAHSNEYMTKLHETNIQLDFVVVLDFASMPYDSSETLMQVNDALIEAALSIVEEVVRHDTSCSLLYLSKDNQVVRYGSAVRDNLPDLVSDFAVINPHPSADYADASFMVANESRNHNRATNVIVVTSRATSALIRELQSVKSQGRSPELYMIVPQIWTQREVEQEIACLKLLDEFDIPYFVVETDPITPTNAGGEE